MWLFWSLACCRARLTLGSLGCTCTTHIHTYTHKRLEIAMCGPLRARAVPIRYGASTGVRDHPGRPQARVAARAHARSHHAHTHTHTHMVQVLKDHPPALSVLGQGGGLGTQSTCAVVSGVIKCVGCFRTRSGGGFAQATRIFTGKGRG